MNKIRYALALVTSTGNVTKGEIYKVINHYEQNGIIEIISDSDELRAYGIEWFKDVSIQMRSKTINTILE